MSNAKDQYETTGFSLGFNPMNILQWIILMQNEYGTEKTIQNITKPKP
jgi:hypothetical protein